MIIDRGLVGVKDKVVGAYAASGLSREHRRDPAAIGAYATQSLPTYLPGNLCRVGDRTWIVEYR